MPFDVAATIESAFDLGKSAIERIWPDPIKRAEELRKLEELRQAGDLEQLNAEVQLLLGQLKINMEEAKHKSLFVAGWRPFIGWVGGVALAYQFILYPLLMWIWYTASAMGKIPAGVEPPPILDTGALFAVVTAMLGIGTMRSFDKRNRVSTEHLGGGK